MAYGVGNVQRFRLLARAGGLDGGYTVGQHRTPPQ